MLFDYLSCCIEAFALYPVECNFAHCVKVATCLKTRTPTILQTSSAHIGLVSQAFCCLEYQFTTR